MLLKNNICCFCCRKLLILSTPPKNWRHKGKYNFLRGLRQKFRQKFLPEGLPPTSCHFVILLKSATWQHMWSSKSICKNCRNPRGVNSLWGTSIGSDFFSKVKKKFESFCRVNKFPEIPQIFQRWLYLSKDFFPFFVPKKVWVMFNQFPCKEAERDAYVRPVGSDV